MPQRRRARTARYRRLPNARILADVGHGGACPYGRKRALEIATTLAMDPKMMLLDEPTQGMGHEGRRRITQLIKPVAANRTVLMVSTT